MGVLQDYEDVAIITCGLVTHRQKKTRECGGLRNKLSLMKESFLEKSSLKPMQAACLAAKAFQNQGTVVFIQTCKNNMVVAISQLVVAAGG